MRVHVVRFSLVVVALGATSLLAFSVVAENQGRAPRITQEHSLAVHQETAGALDWVNDGAQVRSAATEPENMPVGADGEFPTFPLPDGNPQPLGPEVFNSGFRDPLPQTPVWNPSGPKRVGLQVGHWFAGTSPPELSRLSPGTSSGGWAEWEVNLLVARRAAEMLEESGVQVDLLPAVIPVRYRAHAFLAIHADGDSAGRYSGYKAARPAFSSVPDADDQFVRTLLREYRAATGMEQDSDDHISRRMLYYYAFNTRRYQHAIDVGTPAAIIEMGFLTHAGDRAFLTGRPELVARGIANGVLKFLELELGGTGSATAGSERGRSE